VTVRASPVTARRGPAGRAAGCGILAGVRAPRPSRLLGAALLLGVAVLLAPRAGDPAPTAVSAAAAAVQAPPAAAGPEPIPAPALSDLLAGLLTDDVPAAGTGELVVVPGSRPAPGPGPVRTLRVEVERGVPVDPDAFAAFVMATLTAPQGWGRDGTVTFARTDGPAPLQVVLASPATTERLCRPLVTRGRLSCRTGERVVITHHRWVHGTEEYAADLTAYRRYVVNHEVGHALGYGHVPCPAPGAPAPVMQQQTLGLDGCVPNPWPHP
jgi:hypothetical protein